MRRLLELPLIIILMGICALMMYLPVFHAVTVRDWLSARSFFYAGTLFLTLVIFLGVATFHTRPRSLARSHLTALVGAYLLLPVMLAWPFYEAVQNTSFFNAWFEMVSSLTTTGATLFEPDRLRETLHLWRATVGWMGGLFIWVTAAAIMAPLNLGGFEVTSMARPGAGAKRDRVLDADAQTDPRERLLRLTLQMGPVYVALTGLLWVSLVGAGEDPLIAICHAMSVLSTSGISPVAGLSEAQSGLAGSVVIGKGVLVGGQVGIADHLNVGDCARIAAKSVSSSSTAARATTSGRRCSAPSTPHRTNTPYASWWPPMRCAKG